MALPRRGLAPVRRGRRRRGKTNVVVCMGVHSGPPGVCGAGAWVIPAVEAGAGAQAFFGLLAGVVVDACTRPMACSRAHWL